MDLLLLYLSLRYLYINFSLLWLPLGVNCILNMLWVINLWFCLTCLEQYIQFQKYQSTQIHFCQKLIKSIAFFNFSFIEIYDICALFYSRWIISLKSTMKPTIIHKMFDTNSSFELKQRTVEKVEFLFFRIFLLKKSSFREENWVLGNNSMKFWDFSDIS